MSVFSSRWTPVAVLVLGLGCTALAARELSLAARQRDQQRFENAVRRLEVALSNRLEADLTLLRASAGLLAPSSGYAGPEIFKPFLAAFQLEKRTGIRAVGLSRKAVAKQLPDLIDEGRRRYEPSFKFWPENPPRPEYHVVMMAQPANDANHASVGFDMSTIAVIRTAIEQARDSGGFVTTEAALIPATRNHPAHPSFAVLAPVYKSEARLTDAKARRSALTGIVFISFRAGDLLQSVFGPTPPADATFMIQDSRGAAGESLVLYRSPGNGDAATPSEKPAFTATLPIDVAGRTWTLTARSTPAFEAGTGARLTRAMVVGGSIVSLLLAGLTVLQVRARTIADRQRAAAAQAVRQAHTAAERLDLVLKASGIGLWTCELPFKRLTWDERVAAMFFMPGVSETTFDEALERVHPEDVERVRGVLRTSSESRAPFDVEYRTLSADGAQTCYVRSIGRPATRASASSPARDDAADALPIEFHGLTVDVTARKQAWLDADAARRQAEEARAQAEQAGRVKDEFLATLGHELRTPLNAILGWSQLLRRQEYLDPAIEEGLVVIERNARVQDQLVADLLDVGRIVSGKVRLEVEVVDLAAAVRASADSVRPAAQAKQINLELALDHSVGPVRGDPARLQQIVWNLLTNAIKFTPKGGNVHVSLGRSNDRAVIMVTDTGDGIDPAFLPHVFDRFTQQDISTTRRHGGLGIGLSIVRNLTDLHGGQVRAESPGRGHGATFVVELPLLAVTSVGAGAASDDGDARATSASSRSAPAEAGAGPLTEITVLVVDDEPDARELARRVLSEAGAAVLCAASGAEALERVRRERPTVILGDIGMPNMDGYEFIRQLRAMPTDDGGATPAAAVTAFARPDDRERALAAGYQGHVSKPLTAAELVAVAAALAGAGSACGRI